ncbi:MULTISPECIES: ubiquinol oxidase subunit II [Pseudooceanicola]|uniref:ubiquinol oxidase subunit II n=1 Tax=Pseudooceanicola TaxID=1679449 RepID=UPI001EF155D7|nr:MULTISPECIES: ubiquinol oxidase subunit II [Pseudooceanicola]
MLRPWKILFALAMTVALSGCRYEVLFPSGWVAAQERNLLVISTVIMLIVVIPVVVMAVYFPWKYRSSRQDKTDYDPEFTHSNKIEVVVWGVPILIVIALGIFTAIYTYRLDPYRPLDYAGLENKDTPIEVEAVSLDWKWLFIYPQYGVASVNELAIPVDHPINLRLSSSTVMNTFAVPALAGMVYSMPAMETKLHMIADKEGTFESRSGHYSGPGFSKMTFQTISMSEGDFKGWIQKAAASNAPLTRTSYLQLEKPTIAEPVHYYSSVEDNLFDRVVGLCVEPGKVCMSTMMMQDKQGGGGLAGIKNKPAYEYDDERAIDSFGNPINEGAEPTESHDQEELSSLEVQRGTHVN